MALAVIFHLVAVVHFYYGFWYDRTHMTDPDAKWRGFEFGGRLSEDKKTRKIFLIKRFFVVYLTLWNMVIQC